VWSTKLRRPPGSPSGPLPRLRASVRRSGSIPIPQAGARRFIERAALYAERPVDACTWALIPSLDECSYDIDQVGRRSTKDRVGPLFVFGDREEVRLMIALMSISRI